MCQLKVIWMEESTSARILWASPAQQYPVVMHKDEKLQKLRNLGNTKQIN